MREAPLHGRWQNPSRRGPNLIAERDFFMDHLLVRIHRIIQTIQ